MVKVRCTILRACPRTVCGR